jgi:Na+/H+-translocating membrane pyrophosphatase
MAIIFAALAIQNKKEFYIRLVHPLLITSIALGTSIYTFFLIQMNSTPPMLTQIIFSIATMFLFAAILEIHIMTYQSYKALRHPKTES